MYNTIHVHVLYMYDTKLLWFQAEPSKILISFWESKMNTTLKTTK